MRYQFTLDTFDCTIIKTDEGITLIADNLESGQTFTKTINEDSVKAISKDSFFDLSTTYQAIQDYFEEKPETAFLSITPQGKLSYTCKLNFGKMIKDLGFEIQLDKKEIDVEKAIEKLCSRMSKIESQNNGRGQEEVLDKKLAMYFSDFEKRLFERLEGIEKRLSKLEGNNNQQQKTDSPQEEEEKEAPTGLKLEWSQDSYNASNFIFSNDNKTITAKASASGQHVFTKEPLPKSKKFKLSFRVEDNPQRGLCLGIAPVETSKESYPFRNPKTYLYCSGGNIWKDGNSERLKNPTPGKGDIVTLIVDINRGELTVDLNGTVVDNHTLNVEDMKSMDFNGFVYMSIDGGSVTLL